jgi:hypothetical protein
MENIYRIRQKPMLLTEGNLDYSSSDHRSQVGYIDRMQYGCWRLMRGVKFACVLDFFPSNHYTEAIVFKGLTRKVVYR